jgi:hypothetical protein
MMQSVSAQSMPPSKSSSAPLSQISSRPTVPPVPPWPLVLAELDAGPPPELEAELDAGPPPELEAELDAGPCPPCPPVLIDELAMPPALLAVPEDADDDALCSPPAPPALCSLQPSMPNT